MDIIEMMGFVASGLVLAAFTMRTMVPLRLLSISSNVAFIVYGFVGGIVPVLILHAVLLPLNVYRLLEIRRTIAAMERATTGSNRLDWLLPYMSRMSLAAGTSLFQKGEPANAMYYIASGRVRLAEFGIELGRGDMVGEIGLFVPDGRRTATADCVDACEFLSITGDKVREMAFQRPDFAFHMLGVIAGRLIEDVAQLEAMVGASRPARSG